MAIKALGVALLVAAGVLVPGVPAGAADGLITFRVEGTVVSVEDASVAAGAPYVLEYSFDPSTAPSYLGSNGAVYPAVVSMSFAIGGTPIASSQSGDVTVQNDFDGVDGYQLDFLNVTAATEIGVGPLSHVEVVMRSTDDPITGLGLPTTPPDPSQYLPYRTSVLVLVFEPTTGPPACPFCPEVPQFSWVDASVDSITVVQSGPDTDGDGVADAIQSGLGVFQSGSTVGRILTSDGILVEDAADPLGVRITTTTGPATLEMCAGLFAVSLAANSDVTYTCGSVTAQVTSGATTIGIGPGGFVTVPSGGVVTVDRLASGSYVVVNKGATTVTVTRGGVTSALAAGATTASAPQSKDDCKKGGWAAYGIFKNQGSCVSSVATPR